MKYSYFEAKKRELKHINIIPKEQNYVFNIDFENLNDNFKGNKTLEETITNKKILIKNINLTKEKILEKLENIEHEDVIFCYKYFNFFPKYYNRNVKILILMPIVKTKENYYITNAFFNEFEYKNENKISFNYYDFDELQDIIKKYQYKKFIAENIANEIIFDLIDDRNMALWNYEIENIDKGMEFEFYE